FRTKPHDVAKGPFYGVGGKILSGRTKDQNIGYVAEYLTAVGIDLKEVRVVGDEEGAIVDALNALQHSAPTYSLDHADPRCHHRRLRCEGIRCADQYRSARARFGNVLGNKRGRTVANNPAPGEFNR